MGEAHPPMAEEAKQTKPSHDKARGGRPKAVGAGAPMKQHNAGLATGVVSEISLCEDETAKRDQ